MSSILILLLLIGLYTEAEMSQWTDWVHLHETSVAPDGFITAVVYHINSIHNLNITLTNEMKSFPPWIPFYLLTDNTSPILQVDKGL